MMQLIINTLNFITWNVRPEILEGFHVRWYGLLFAIGFLTAYYILGSIFKLEKKPQKTLDNMTFTAFIGLIIGLRLGHCFFYEPEYYLSNPIEILFVWQGGLASHGGAIGLITAFFWFARKYKVDYIWVLSRAAIVIPLTGAFVRIGNLMNSEIYGIPTDLPWGFIFIRDGQSIPRHPTQIYEALAYIFIFLINYAYYRKAFKQNKVSNYILVGLSLTLIFTSRFFIEFVKTEQVNFEKGMPLDMGQILSIPFILIGLTFFYLHNRKQKNIQG